MGKEHIRAFPDGLFHHLVRGVQRHQDLFKMCIRDRMKAYLNQQQEIRHQEEVITKLKSFNREKSIKRAESREKMLAKIEVLEKPVEVNDEMHIALEPNITSGNDVPVSYTHLDVYKRQVTFSSLDFLYLQKR